MDNLWGVCVYILVTQLGYVVSACCTRTQIGPTCLRDEAKRKVMAEQWKAPGSNEVTLD